MRLIFITFEGGEGSGKTTQIELLADWLSSQGKNVVTVRDPGGTHVSEKIREILKCRDNAIAPHTEALLYLAARAQMVIEVIFPSLNEGKFIICDRFTDSTMVYQGYAGGLDVGHLCDFASHGLVPHFTFLLQIDPKDGLARKMGQGELDRIEAKGLEFHKKVAEGYQMMSENTNVVVIDAILPIQEIHNKIIEYIGGEL